MATNRFSWNEFHISGDVRRQYGFDDTLASSTGNIVFVNTAAARSLAAKLNERLPAEEQVSAGNLNAMGIVDEALHYCCSLFRQDENPSAFDQVYASLCKRLGTQEVGRLLEDFTREFPPRSVYRGEETAPEYLGRTAWDAAAGQERPNRVQALEEMILLRLANENPAFGPFRFLFDDSGLAKNKTFQPAWECIKEEFKKQPIFGPYKNDLITMLKEPVAFSPFSLKGQIDYIRTHWGKLFYEWFRRLFSALDTISEEEKPGWGPLGGAPDMEPYTYNSAEYERFSADREWMPRVVLLAKMALVWMTQLSREYGREISRLDQIPEEELDSIARRGFTGLWLIGIWERSRASERIKHLCGNPEAAASAYSLLDYEIAPNLGGWEALDNLRKRLWRRGVRLAADMVPNHTGIDSKWVVEKPDLFMTAPGNPFPQYTFNGENLSGDSRVSIFLEDHYYSRSDCAVVFKRVDNATGGARYIYHGNDGTGLPWNDTAQIDFLNPQAREEVIQKILHVARNFPIIRFDAAMVLAKRHIRRLWYPAPGQGGDIASRADFALTDGEFESRIPQEFWREVVDRIASETPDTLLLAEAFWMLEGYFVRTLGMHRVYNSAFMNMLKKEENQKYRETIKNTIDFDPQVLKRFVNFMNNPDEETAEAQFGKGDKYFGVCTMMVTMPGLPMFGHGQIEGFTEKYGMEYTRDYKNETPDRSLVERHEREIFPLMKKRPLFSGIENFLLFDLRNADGVNENVFAYANRAGEERAFVFYNNAYQEAAGWIKESYPFGVTPESPKETRSVAFALGLTPAPEEYCVFREQRSGLFFIRKSADIREQGLFVRLRGYECQALMDIRRVEDDETGKYSLLCRELAGRGVPDIQEELEDVFLKGLLTAYEKALSEIAAGLPALRGQGIHAAPTGAALTRKAAFEALKPAALEFFRVCGVFLGGNYGAASVLSKRKKTTDGADRVDGERVWRKLRARLTRLGRMWEAAAWIPASSAGMTEASSAAAAEAASPAPAAAAAAASVKAEAASAALSAPAAEEEAASPAAEAEAAAASVKAAAFVPFVSNSSPCLFETLAAFCLLFSLKDIAGARCTAARLQKLIRLWALDRRTARTLSSASLAVRHEAELCVQTVLAGLPFATRSYHGEALGSDAHALAEMLLEGKSGARVCGVNEFNQVLWFNKERYEAAVLTALTAHTLFCRKEKPGERDVLLAALLAAEEASEYKAEKLLALLETPAISSEMRFTKERKKPIVS